MNNVLITITEASEPSAAAQSTSPNKEFINAPQSTSSNKQGHERKSVGIIERLAILGAQERKCKAKISFGASRQLEEACDNMLQAQQEAEVRKLQSMQAQQQACETSSCS